MPDKQKISIEKNIEDREWFDLMVQERGDRFWELCRARLFDDVADEVAKDDMTRLEAYTFGETKMTFGQHQGRRLSDIPTKYLDWLASTVTWTKELNRYVRYRNENRRIN